MKSFTVEIDDDTYFFLEFLERTRFIKNKDEVVRKALIMFKDLSMHDWLPHLYRIGSSRVILIERGMLRARTRVGWVLVKMMWKGFTVSLSKD